MKIVLFGPPGVGKGTYASSLKTIYNLAHISTGDLFRENIKHQTELGKKAKAFIDAGKLVPDEITISMLKYRISADDTKKGFMLDGFPRTIPQAEALDTLIDVDAVLSFEAAEQTILKRVEGRRICRKCGMIYHTKNKPPLEEGVCDTCGGEVYQREDERRDVFEMRIKAYNEQTRPLIGYYDKKNILYRIDANTDMNNPEFHVIDDCRKILDKYLRNYNRDSTNVEEIKDKK
ncbi:MAG: adenylate kinase [Spirochaetales bacterium]|nr:adenylate kinase [Spirochaetales bacterium]